MSDQKIDLDALEKLAQSPGAAQMNCVMLTPAVVLELIRMARAAPSPDAGQADHIADDLTMVAAPSNDSADLHRPLTEAELSTYRFGYICGKLANIQDAIARSGGSKT